MVNVEISKLVEEFATVAALRMSQVSVANDGQGWKAPAYWVM